MLGGAYEMTFDAASIRRIAALVYAQPVFEMYYRSAMRASVNRVNALAQKNAPVGDYPNEKNHTGGNLRRGIRGFVDTPYRGRVGVLASVPYGARREFGFDGKTDSMGRYYPMDPKDADKRSHMMYVHRALEASLPYIASAFKASTSLAIRKIVM
jgi:hypothetical protein